MSIKFQNLSGKSIDLTHLKPEDICIEDIAHALSLQCRYNGQIKEFYSVAQHSSLVSRLVYYDTKDKTLALCGLLHDAAEAYIGDIITPIKHMFAGLMRLEAMVLDVVLKEEGVDLYRTYIKNIDLIDKYDKFCLDFEMKYFYGNNKLIFDMLPDTSIVSEIVFLQQYHYYRS